MKPIKFKEMTTELNKPDSMTQRQCESLPVLQYNNNTCISCWKLSIWDKIKVIFTGKIWLGVHSGKTQPPVYIVVDKPFK